MHLPALIRRDALAPPSTEVYESSCKSGLSWFKWCPIDFILWALLAIVISLVFWKIHARRRAAKVLETPLTGQNPTRSRHKGYCRLTLPYPSGSSPSEPSPSYKEAYEYESKHDGANFNTLMDPYHVVHNIDNSLISKDVNFTGASIPQPTLEQKKSGRVSGLGLGLGINMAERSSPIPEYAEKSAEDNHEQLSVTPPPPPAYLRNPRWDM